MTDDATTGMRTSRSDGDRSVLVVVAAFVVFVVVAPLLGDRLGSWQLALWPLLGFAAASYRHLAGLVSALSAVVVMLLATLTSTNSTAALGFLYAPMLGGFVLAGVGLRMLVDWMGGRRDRMGASPRVGVVLLGLLVVVVSMFAVGPLADAGGPSP